MDLTERELRIWRASKIGDIVPMGDRLLRISYIDEVTGRAGGMILTCVWYAMCEEMAEYLAPAPILGPVPACEVHARMSRADLS